MFAIDSKEEIKVGIGRLFNSKKVIGERQAIVSERSLNALQVNIGQKVTIYYDFKLLLNMFQTMTGQMVPNMLSKGASQEELLDDSTRHVIAQEVGEFLAQIFKF